MHWLDQVEGMRFDGIQAYDADGVSPVGCLIGRIPGEDGVTEGAVYLVDPEEDEDGNTLYTAWAVYR